MAHFIVIVAAASTGRPLGTACSAAASTTPACRHVPRPVSSGTTASPILILVTCVTRPHYFFTWSMVSDIGNLCNKSVLNADYLEELHSCTLSILIRFLRSTSIGPTVGKWALECPEIKLLTSEPTSKTTPTPSFPGTAGSGGFSGYFPSMVLMSDGLMGACHEQIGSSMQW